MLQGIGPAAPQAFSPQSLNQTNQVASRWGLPTTVTGQQNVVMPANQFSSMLQGLVSSIYQGVQQVMQTFTQSIMALTGRGAQAAGGAEMAPPTATPAGGSPQVEGSAAAQGESPSIGDMIKDGLTKLAKDGKDFLKDLWGGLNSAWKIGGLFTGGGIKSLFSKGVSLIKKIF